MRTEVKISLATARGLPLGRGRSWSAREHVRALLVASASLLIAGGLLFCSFSGRALALSGWQVRVIDTPVTRVEPSFATASGRYLAWTGSAQGESRMYVFDLLDGQNAVIPLSPPGAYYNPDAEGDWLVFQGARAGGYDDIYLYNFKSRAVAKITSNSDPGDWNDWNPRLQGGRVVWEKQMQGPSAAPGIYLYDLSDETTTLVLAGSDYHEPDLWGDYLVCTRSVPEAGSNAAEIVLHNLATGESIVIASATSANGHPRIDDGRVVWTAGAIWPEGGEDNWASYQIYVYDIDTEETTRLTDDAAGNTAPSLEGDLVVWQTRSPSAVKAYDLAAGSQTDVSRSGDVARAPDLDGSHVVWYGKSGLYYAVPASEATKFPDVPQGHHYLTAIEEVTALGLMDGYGNGHFGPNDWTIRQQFAKMMVLALELPVTEDDLYDFTDEPPVVHLEDSLYPYHYAAVAARTGLVEPYADGTFRPLYRVARDLAVTAVVTGAASVLEQPPLSYVGTLSHPDPLIQEYLRIAEFNGLLENLVGPQGDLASWDPQQPATRAELAQLLYNLWHKLH